MSEIPDYTRNFVAVRTYKAVYRTAQTELDVLLEFSTTALEKNLLFTEINGKEIRVNSIHDLVNLLPSVVSLSIPHNVQLLWNGATKDAEIVETYRPSQKPEYPSTASLQLSLTVESKTYETALCYTLQDAIWELQEMVGAQSDWKLRACYHCRYNGQARDYALSDREYWCYRDVPEAFAEIQSKGKYASVDVRFAGRFFVDAFHTCAAWQPRPAVTT